MPNTAANYRSGAWVCKPAKVNCSREKFLTVSEGLGSLVKEATSTELLSLDRSKIEGMFKEIQAIRAKTSS